MIDKHTAPAILRVPGLMAETPDRSHLSSCCVFWCRSDSSDIRLSIGLLLHFFMFLRVPSHFLHISIPYLCVIFVYLRDIFMYFSYSFICPPPFIPSFPVTSLGLPLHYLAFLLPGFSQSV